MSELSNTILAGTEEMRRAAGTRIDERSARRQRDRVAMQAIGEDIGQIGDLIEEKRGEDDEKEINDAYSLGLTSGGPDKALVALEAVRPRTAKGAKRRVDLLTQVEKIAGERMDRRLQQAQIYNYDEDNKLARKKAEDIEMGNDEVNYLTQSMPQGLTMRQQRDWWAAQPTSSKAARDHIGKITPLLNKAADAEVAQEKLTSIQTAKELTQEQARKAMTAFSQRFGLDGKPLTQEQRIMYAETLAPDDKTRTQIREMAKNEQYAENRARLAKLGEDKLAATKEKNQADADHDNFMEQLGSANIDIRTALAQNEGARRTATQLVVAYTVAEQKHANMLAMIQANEDLDDTLKETLVNNLTIQMNDAKTKKNQMQTALNAALSAQLPKAPQPGQGGSTKKTVQDMTDEELLKIATGK